jgi:alkanesulfonate monooxygenase SsuD/methylene tetrahydromethanopterin reductase-like flavin-dependent oxidoreductase (luciferase family)
VRVETLLPLGKLDPGLRATETPLDIRRVAEDARLVEDLGYDGLAVEETKDDPYAVMALAAQATTRLRLTTAVAMAFPRSPTITAMSAWTLQKLSGGRFVLGLGSQVRGHIARRFGLDYRPPGRGCATTSAPCERCGRAGRLRRRSRSRATTTG